MSEVSKVKTTIDMECICGNTLVFMIDGYNNEVSTQCCECSRQITVKKSVSIIIKKLKWKQEREAVAAGLSVEFRREKTGKWEVIDSPTWLEGYEYRIKEFKPAVYRSRAGSIMYFQTETSGILLVGSSVLHRSNVVSCLNTTEWTHIKC